MVIGVNKDYAKETVSYVNKWTVFTVWLICFFLSNCFYLQNCWNDISEYHYDIWLTGSLVYIDVVVIYKTLIKFKNTLQIKHFCYGHKI